MHSRLRIFLLATISVCSLTGLASTLHGATFTPGNLVLLRAGDGVASTVGNSTALPVALQEYTLTGSLVQTIDVPSTGENALTVQLRNANSSTTLTGEGLLSRSPNGEWVTFGGYRADAGLANPRTGTTPATNPRLVGVVGGSGIVNTSTGLSNGLDQSPLSVATDDGNRFWIGGIGGSGNGGIFYIGPENVGGINEFSAQVWNVNVRKVQIFGSNLFYSTGSNPAPGRGVHQLGAGLPTEPATASPDIVYSSGTNSPFFFANLGSGNDWNGTGYDTLYTSTISNVGGNGLITKFSFDGAAWTLTDGIPVPGLVDYAATQTDQSVTFYMVTNTSATTTLQTVTDSSGFNGFIGATPTMLLDLETDLYAYTGITFAPVGGATVVPGDFNGDGNVDGADFVVWQTNFPNSSGNATLATGDANGDGNVDGADFVVWQTNFPFVGGGGAVPVPEPHAFVLVIAGSVVLGARVVRARRHGR